MLDNDYEICYLAKCLPLIDDVNKIVRCYIVNLSKMNLYQTIDHHIHKIIDDCEKDINSCHDMEKSYRRYSTTISRNIKLLQTIAILVVDNYSWRYHIGANKDSLCRHIEHIISLSIVCSSWGIYIEY